MMPYTQQTEQTETDPLVVTSTSPYISRLLFLPSLPVPYNTYSCPTSSNAIHMYEYHVCNYGRDRPSISRVSDTATIILRSTVYIGLFKKMGLLHSNTCVCLVRVYVSSV